MALMVPLPGGDYATIDTDDPEVARKTVRRYLASKFLLGNKSGKPDRPTAMDTAATSLANGLTFGGFNVGEGAAMSELTGVKNLISRLRGQEPEFGMGDAYAATRDIQKQRSRQANAPLLEGGFGLLGGLRAPGMSKVGDFVGGKLGANAPGFLKGLMTNESLPAISLRSAAAGAPMGAIAGATTADPGHEAQGAAQGAGLGTVTGGLIPSGTGLASRGVKLGGQALKPVADIVRGGLNIAGLKRDPSAVAVKNLIEALRADRATPDQMRQILKEWQAHSADGAAPSILDLASKLPSGGANVRRMVTNAGLTDLGSGVARSYAKQVATNLPENADTIVRRLAKNEPRTAGAVAQDIKATQRGIADEMYPAPYGETIQAGPQITEALGDKYGTAAIGRAIDEATARQQYGRVDRLKGLLHGDTEDPAVTEWLARPRIGDSEFALPPHILDRIKAEMPQNAEAVGLTAGDLDRVKIHMGRMGADYANSNPGVGGGLTDRAQKLDQVLADIPGLRQARETYRGYASRDEALDLGKGVLGQSDTAIKPSEEFIPALQEKVKGATSGDNPFPVSADQIRQDAGVGYRQGAINAIEDPAAGGSGIINKLASSPRQRKIQDAIYDPEVAASVRQGLNDQMLSLHNARLVDPTFGSQSTPRALSMVDLGNVPKSGSDTVMRILSKIHQAAALTPEEREAIAKAGLATFDHEGVISQMHPSVRPVLDTIDEWARTLAVPEAGEVEKRYQNAPDLISDPLPQ